MAQINNVPERWGALARPFLQRAQEFQQRQPVVSYFLRRHVAFACMRDRPKNDPQCRAFLNTLLDELEKEANALGAEVKEERGKATLGLMGLRLFGHADQQEREGVANINIVRLFYTAAVLLEATAQFASDGVLDAETAEKCKYAKYIATRMKKALDTGTPYESPNKEEQAEASAMANALASAEQTALNNNINNASPAAAAAAAAADAAPAYPASAAATNNTSGGAAHIPQSATAPPDYESGEDEGNTNNMNGNYNMMGGGGGGGAGQPNAYNDFASLPPPPPFPPTALPHPHLVPHENNNNSNAGNPLPPPYSSYNSPPPPQQPQPQQVQQPQPTSVSELAARVALRRSSGPSASGEKAPSIETMIDAQKCARQAVSALQFYDHETAIAQLREALKMLVQGA